jgi:putative hydrolase of the HAD superfamily
VTLRAAIFDLGGVVLDSPLDAIADFERRSGMPLGTINRVVVESGARGAWARHERGELDRQSFLESFTVELADAGFVVDTAALMADIDASIRVRPAMVQAVDDLRAQGVRVAALTNNWTPFGPDGLARHFDVVVESVVEGTRKPEPRIYRICLDRLAVEPEACVMFDDLGPNLKPARDLGITTVKVTSPDQLLAEIGFRFG